jgi:(E)-4-hydroxy-3-methylbut-2-enyl-diphosphate synthase
MQTKRKTTRRIYVGQVPIGDGAPIAVQSMTNTDTRDVSSTIHQIEQLSEAGCEIIRLAIPDREAAVAFKDIKSKVKKPLIADIHFDHRLALATLDAGADGLRINPGNIGTHENVAKVVKAAGDLNVPIRIGVNSGSLHKEILQKYGYPSPEAMVESALKHVRIIEDLGFDQIKISLKSSNVINTIEAYKLLHEKVDYPLHIGVTEAGTLISGTVKSAIGIGYLLANGIGDTLRVSLTRDPVDEVRVAYEILRALDIRHRGPEIISCPTCGRCEIDLFGLVEEVERALSGIETSPKVAIMGCVVNGPGEAKEADIGIAGGRGQGILFKKGKVLRKVSENKIAEVLISEVKKLV